MTQHKSHHKSHAPPEGENAPAKPREESSSPEPSPQQAAAGTVQAQGNALQAERDDLLARLQRVSADYLNYQKRVQRDSAQAREYANEEIIKSLLGVLDDMERALAAARQNHPAEDPLLVGMDLVHKKALETLGRFGLSRIPSEGQPFDPEKHSALMQQSSDKHPPRTVLKELQAGYQLKDRTLRPAHVIVSKEPDEQAESETKESE
jgi:molecular chaperone GrpE